jgi:hypothetical protein
MLLDTVIIVGVTSLALLWVGSIMMIMQAAWDTVGDHILNLIEKIAGKFKR